MLQRRFLPENDPCVLQHGSQPVLYADDGLVGGAQEKCLHKIELGSKMVVIFNHVETNAEAYTTVISAPHFNVKT